MSDFLDRLVVRAIGSETSLAPRLPSLFEPLQRAPVMAQPEVDEALHGNDEPGSVAAPAPAFAPLRATSSAVTAQPDHSRVAGLTMAREATSSPVRAAMGTPRGMFRPASTAVAPNATPVVELAAALPTPTEAVGPLPIRPRQTRIAADPPAPTAPQREAPGALLPAATPVFGAMRASDTSGRSTAAAVAGASAAAVGSASEPVVHVSIGRLEVRAAPATPTPARRCDGPQPGSLDDYLRQRGKASR
jgi:hypothetical protein